MTCAASSASLFFIFRKGGGLRLRFSTDVDHFRSLERSIIFCGKNSIIAKHSSDISGTVITLFIP